jgi:hypothetical protein
MMDGQDWPRGDFATLALQAHEVKYLEIEQSGLQPDAVALAEVNLLSVIQDGLEL